MRGANPMYGATIGILPGNAEGGMATRRQWSDLSGRTRGLLAVTADA